MTRLYNRTAPKARRKHCRIRTFDFNTLYPTIPQAKMIEKLHLLVDLCSQSGVHPPMLPFTHIKFNNSAAVKQGTFCHAPPSPLPKRKKGEVKWYFIPLHKLKAMIVYLIKNIYVRLGDATFLQTIGIPMGTNCAVYIANFFLYAFELEFIQKHLTLGRVDFIRSFTFTKRFLDDLISVDNPLFERWCTLDDPNCILEGKQCGLYPREVTLGKESEGRAAPFLDLFLYINSKANYCIFSTLYEKSGDPKFERLAFYRYPHIMSKLSANCKYNII